jgi:hypothetical protein
MENKYKAQARYDKKNTVSVSLKFNKKTDADILERLDEVNSKQGYIKTLVREDMKKKGGGPATGIDPVTEPL